MEEDETVFVKQYLHFMDSKVGTRKPDPLREIVYGKEVGEVLHFEFLYFGTGGRLGHSSVYSEANKYEQPWWYPKLGLPLPLEIKQKPAFGDKYPGDHDDIALRSQIRCGPRQMKRLSTK